MAIEDIIRNGVGIEKGLLVDFLGDLDERVNDLVAGSGALVYETLAELEADLDHPANRRAEVVADTNSPPANGVYMKVGDSGAGSWLKVADLGTEVLGERIDALDVEKADVTVTDALNTRVETIAPRVLLRISVTGQVGNAITGTTLETIASYSTSQQFRFIPNETNTGPVTLAIDGLAALPVYDSAGEELGAGELAANRQYMVAPSGTGPSHFRLLNSGILPSEITEILAALTGLETSGVLRLTTSSFLANAIVATTATGLEEYSSDQLFILSVAGANSGDVTLSIDGLAALPLLDDTSQQLPANTLRTGGLYLVGLTRGLTSFRLLSSTIHLQDVHDAIDQRAFHRATVQEVDGSHIKLTTSFGITEYVFDQVFRFISNFTNTGACTISVDGLAEKPLYDSEGNEISAGEIQDNHYYVVAPSGTGVSHFRLIGSGYTKSEVDALVAGKASSSISIIGAGLATGGGNLSSSRTITVPIASSPETIAGTIGNKAVVPSGLKAALDALDVDSTGHPQNFTPASARPGDSPELFTDVLTSGDPDDRPELDSALVQQDTDGAVVRITTAKTIAPRALLPMEPNRIYLVRYVVRRRGDPPNPVTSKVQLRLAWYNNIKTFQSATLVSDLTDLTVSDGRQESSIVVARAAGSDVDVVAPAGIRYARPYVQTLGTDHSTDVEVIGWEDVTDATLYSPDVADVTSRIAAIESLDVGSRLDDLETTVGTPSMARHQTLAAATAATIPATVDSVYVDGNAAVGDRGNGLYVRVVSEPTHDGKFQSVDGAWWEIAEVKLHASHFGVLTDGSDQKANLQSAIETAAALGRTLLLPSGQTITIASDLHVAIPGTFLRIEKDGAESARIYSTSTTSDDKLRIEGEFVAAADLTKNAANGSRYVTVSDASQVEVGMLAQVISSKAWYQDPRENPNLPSSAGTVVSATANTITIPLDEALADGSPLIGAGISILYGPGWGEARRIESVSIDNPNLQVTFTLNRDWDTTPDSTSVYRLPQCYKGELHEVAEVNASVLAFRVPLWDGYDVAVDAYGGTAKEDVSIRFYRPVTVELDGVFVEWDNSDPGPNCQALAIVHGRDCVIDDTTLKNVRRTGIRIDLSYNTLIRRPQVYGADDLFTAYGVHGERASILTVELGQFWGVRRGYDSHSTYFSTAYEIPTKGVRIIECTSFGGGYRDDGQPWGPVYQDKPSKDTAENYGFGSHGPAQDVEYINCKTYGVDTGFLLRARNERIVNPLFIGFMRQAVSVRFGGEHEIINPRYMHTAMIGEDDISVHTTEVLNFDSFNIVGLDGEDFRRTIPQRFLEVWGDGSTKVPYYYRRGKVTVRGGSIHVKDSFAHLFSSAVTEWADFVFRDLDVTIWGEETTSDVHFIYTTGSGSLVRLQDVNNRVKVMQGNYLRYDADLTIDSTCLIVCPDKPLWTATYTTVNATPLTTEITPTSGTHLQGTEILRTNAAATRWKGDKIRGRLSMSVARTDASGTEVLVYIFREEADGTIAFVRGMMVHCPGQNKKVPVVIDFEDDPQTQQEIEYFVIVGPKNGESGGVRVNGSDAGTTLFGSASRERAVLLAEPAS